MSTPVSGVNRIAGLAGSSPAVLAAAAAILAALDARSGRWEGSAAALGRDAGLADAGPCRRAIASMEGAGIVVVHRSGRKVAAIETAAPSAVTAEDLVRQRREDLEAARVRMLAGIAHADPTKAAAASRELRLLHADLASLKTPGVSRTDELARRRQDRRAEVHQRSTGGQ